MQESYLPYHGYLALAVCLLGTMFNMVNILVLMHKDMRYHPINLILTGIAVADCLVMVEYIPFAIHMYLLDDGQKRDKADRVGYTLNILNNLGCKCSVFLCMGHLPLVSCQL